MSVTIEDKESFTVIGKLGKGLSSEGYKWIPAIWQEAKSNFAEIRELVKKDSEGNLVGIWGAMSDISERFERWTERGKYLASCEVSDNSVAPTGWTKWVIPPYKYAVIGCSQDTYQEKFNYMLSEYLPNNGYSIVGAVHEFYNPKETNGNLYLYFPIEKNL
ncbi:GyrI-like domain-containing protein [Paenibacillus alkalitolerans]|uniref:GyrI-like domain-containing protein n=1 Tax=Paenibacillus alkalitolerans TaxID=2799335 RepID=UPI0018F6D96E|nr:GyrI-like domain-containing protein [Paenibacillus alkalitolerans]